MRHLTRFLSKGSLRVIGSAIKLLSFYNVRTYVRTYTWYLRQRGMKIDGQPIYISPTCSFDGTDYGLVRLGDNVVISSLVHFLTHDYSVSGALFAVGVEVGPAVSSVRPIKVGDNCFIGRGTILMPGSSLGKNVIVGAGSVVRGDIPDNSLVLGNPAQIVGNVLEFGESRKKLLREGKLKRDPEYWAGPGAFNSAQQRKSA
jgi:acetyltransferase-like isoleucine patch superfamily enzyme